MAKADLSDKIFVYGPKDVVSIFLNYEFNPGRISDLEVQLNEQMNEWAAGRMPEFNISYRLLAGDRNHLSQGEIVFSPYDGVPVHIEKTARMVLQQKDYSVADIWSLMHHPSSYGLEPLKGQAFLIGVNTSLYKPANILYGAKYVSYHTIALPAQPVPKTESIEMLAAPVAMLDLMKVEP